MGVQVKFFFDHARGLPGARQAHFLVKIVKSFAPERGHQSWKRAEKGPKEDERVGRGHFHERVGESPVREEHFGTSGSAVSFFVSEISQFENA